MNPIETKLVSIGRRILETDQFGPRSNMDALPEWTSLKHVLLLGEVAEAFGAGIHLEDAYRLDTFERLAAYIAANMKRAPAMDYEYPSIGALFHARASALGERSFLIFPKEDVTYSYAEVQRIASTAAHVLAEAGLRRGDRLCLAFPNGPGFLFYYFAAHLLGAVVVPINPALSATEMRYIIANSGARLALFDRSLAELSQGVGHVGPGRTEVATAVSKFGRDSLERRSHDAALMAPAALTLDDPAAILYTSGTTGNPKGVVLSHRNFLADAMALVDWFKFDPGTRTLCILPMFHNNGQVITLLSPLTVGGDTVILEGKSALTSFWKLIDQYQVQWTSVMPAFLAAFLEFGLKRHDTSLKGIVCGGQVLLDEVRSRFESEYRVAVFEGYGLTETTSFSCLNEYPAERRVFGSIGRQLPCNTMKVVRADGSEAVPGETGEILIKGDNVATHYHALPDVTKQRFQDGWLHSGDYGYCDASGNFYFATRLDDMIIKGGENIYPSELENILHTCDEVVECAAFGIPDRILGQDICIYVKMRDGSSYTPSDLEKYMRGRIAQFKQPKHIVIINGLPGMTELPKGPTRKILRRKLQDYFAAQMEEAI